MRPLNNAYIDLTNVVSIHAPARGATLKDSSWSIPNSVSIHAPARGATYRLFKTFTSKYKFQFTHPRGVRLYLPRSYGNRCSFNSRTRAGCDVLKALVNDLYSPVSIHAPARGATLSIFANCKDTIVSIHAPARGATANNYMDAASTASFNSRTRAGCDAACNRCGDFL